MSESAATSPCRLTLPQLRVAPGDSLPTALADAFDALSTHPYAAIVSIPALAGADEDIVGRQVTDALAAMHRLLPHGVSGQSLLAWPIGVNRQPRWASPHNNIAGQSDAATLHTDTPTADHPDRYVAMLCIRPCSRGGGQSQLMPIDGISAQLGADHVATLARVSAPFATDVFAADGSYTYTLCRQPVLFDHTTRIRFRDVMLREGAALAPPGPPLKGALARLNHLISARKAPIATYGLGPGQMLLMDNTKCLHGRTAFHDTSRYMLRWRVAPIADRGG
ncbi:TauD/TfdA family dioxygenase [Mycolicibacterium gadium]|jgi:hypothetical protein|uniref:TauD/TfdA family dioxygenase n=1 Tax=Mycolicibacterium gadium TaxID=1794 RepID=UPI002FDCA2FE